MRESERDKAKKKQVLFSFALQSAALVTRGHKSLYIYGAISGKLLGKGIGISHCRFCCCGERGLQAGSSL